MPSAPSAGKTADLGKIFALHDTDTVRDKIKNWQTAGGGVLQPDEVAVEAQKSDNGAKSDKKSSSSGSSKVKNPLHAKSRSVPEIVDVPQIEAVAAPSTPSKASRSDKQPASEPQIPHIVERKPKSSPSKLDAEIRDAIAPKKRIISDGHWRRKHVDPKAVKPPSPPKPKPPDKPTLAWVRPPLLPRPSDEPPPPKPPPPEPKPIRIYAAKPRTKSFEGSGLSKRTVESPPIAIPTTPRSRGYTATTPKAVTSEEESSPDHVRSSRKARSRAVSRKVEEESGGADERVRNRLTKSRTSGEASHTARKPSNRRSLSAEDTSHRHIKPPSFPKSTYSEDSAEETRRRRQRRRRKPSKETVAVEKSPDSPPKELTNYDEEAERRRATFRNEFAQYTPPRERKTSGRKKTTRRFSYSPEGLDRIPQPEPIAVVPQRQTSSRIENWLVETPDPFKEPLGEAKSKSSRSRRDFSFEQKSARSAPTESTVDTETVITESTALSESTIAPRNSARNATHSRSGSRDLKSPTDRKVRAQSEPSDYLDPEIEIEYSSTTSVPTLKRRGARHATSSPTSKERAKPARTVSSYTESEVTESVVSSSVVSSVLSSSVVSSSVDPRGIGMPNGDPKHNVARRLFPSTGKRLSTIASVETFTTRAQEPIPMSNTIEEKDEDAATVKEDELMELPNLAGSSVVSAARSRASLKRKLTTHADLMTVLSMPATRSKSVVSARSIRTHRSRLETATIEDLMTELASDETKYMRELRTLADGVIPVLLKCVLSKSEAAVAAGLFKSSPHSEKDAVAEASKAIHDMSVAIQRLKSLHTRIPKENHFSLLIWAQSAYSVYEKYIKTWRLGFQDVVVSLASETEGSTVSTPKSAEGGAWDQGLPRNEDGYIVDGDGERVDVAFLLKRPLVRLKHLSKTMKGVNIKKPSEQAGVLAKKFETLMEMARNKVDEEKARLEDEAAALIDPTRARDPKSLAPLAGVKIDATRCVKARDYFDLHLPHSSGQTVDCRLEILARDDAPGKGKGGDILICEVDETGRWLLFPPVDMKRISARAGDEAGELVVMIRGVHSGGEEWDEVFTLTTADEEVRFEWIQMLGLSPAPPPLSRTRSFVAPPARPSSSHASSSLLSESIITSSSTPLKSRTPSPRAIEVPIGERARSGSKRWSKDISSPRTGSETSSFLSSVDSERATLYPRKPKQCEAKYSDTSSYTSVSSYTESDLRSDITPPPQPRVSSSRRTTPRNLNEAMDMAGTGSPALKRARATRYRSSPSAAEKATEKLEPRQTASAQFESNHQPLHHRRSVKKNSASNGFSVWIPTSEQDDSDSDHSVDDDSTASSYLSGRPPLHHRTSSVPSAQLPSLPKVRSGKHDDEMMSGALLPVDKVQTPRMSSKSTTREAPASAPPKLEKRTSTKPVSAPVSPVEDKPPPPPPHRTPSSNQVKFASTPQFSPAVGVKRRSSSPLKHEYRPSSPSSESSYTEDESETSYTSDSDSDDDLNDQDVASTFVSSVVSPTTERPVVPEPMYTIPNGTIKPSESASQAPYRTVPQVVTVDAKPAKCIATIFTWSDRGAWELLHPEDCSIVITPGLIAAYPMSSNHETENLPEERPLIGQELTPLVPLRRGTALDITIRSPPTPASRLKPGANVMFRSRSGEECEVLYNLINRSRINNPTYIALQNARPPQAEGWAAAMDRQNSQRGASSVGWFGRSKSYRASSRAQSIAGNTESSIGTISSVITAMKRFSGSGYIIDKAFSRMSGSGESMGSGGSGSRSPPHFVAPGADAVPEGVGISNAKIRLYALQSKNKWLDLGSAKLSILPKEPGAVVAAPIMLHTGVEKRIVVAKKGKVRDTEEMLLDVTLPEPCFERWARTGIGVSVWVDVLPGAVGGGMEGANGVAKTGGVSEKRVVKYMIQLKSERECAYTFSLLGKLRY